MYFRHIVAPWAPGKVSISFLILMVLLHASLGDIGTSDSTIFYFGDNNYGQNGQPNNTQTDRFLDVHVSLLRSISCGSLTTAYLFKNNTIVSKGLTPVTWKFGTSYPEIASVSSNSGSILYSLTSNASIYVNGSNLFTVLLNDATSVISPPQLSPPRLNEDIRYCTYTACLAFDNFPPGSITNEPVIHEPNIPLYKFIGAWGYLPFSSFGPNPPPQPTSGMYYQGPDLIVKKVSIGVHYSILILHNNTVLVSGDGPVIRSSTDSSLYLPIVYNSTVNHAGVKIVDAAASPNHALLLSEDHRVFFFGANQYFASGIPSLHRSSTVNRVAEVPFDGILYPDDYIIQIATQFARSSAITKMGYVYIWGTRMINTSTSGEVYFVPTLENSYLKDRYAVRYLDQDDITKTTQNAIASCIITRPRAGNCTGAPPSADYYCIGGLWTTRGGSNLETLTISSPTEIDGNLTISGPLVINQQSNISVTQCLSVGSIEIVKQQGDDSPSQDIISTGKNCPDISGASISVIPTGNVKKCQKMTAALLKSETGGRIVYSAIFKVTDNDCKNHYWWIILVSVLGGVVLIVAIAIIVYLTIWRKKRSS